MGSNSQLESVMLQPPGNAVRRPTPADPAPEANPAVFTDEMTVRDKVFIQEQKCAPESELDEDDARSWHWVLYDTTGSGEKKIPVGVIRLVPPPHAPHEHLEPTIEEGVDCTESKEKHDLPFIKVTRVALLPEYRGKGLSRVLFDVAFGWAMEHPEEVDAALGTGEHWDGLVLLHSQTSVEELYKRLGFVTDRGLGTWTEENIQHVGMWKTLELKRSTADNS